MLRKLLLLALVGMIAASMTPFTPAADRALKISIPKRGKLTPVQQLNRDGVEAVNKNQFEKAESLFYKAYLFDPDDPFTLNNLGYISELKGEVERARRFYDLASRQETAATIDRSTSKAAEGKEFKEAVNDIGDTPLQVNRANVEAIRLMNEGRPSEAEAVLKRALDLDPRNPYTLNNMGVVQEMQGDFDLALKYYTRGGRVPLNGACDRDPESQMEGQSPSVRRRLTVRKKFASDCKQTRETKPGWRGLTFKASLPSIAITVRTRVNTSNRPMLWIRTTHFR